MKDRSSVLDSPGIENSIEITLSHTLKEIQANLSFSLFAKDSKIQNGRHFWNEEKFLKIGHSILHISFLISFKLKALHINTLALRLDTVIQGALLSKFKPGTLRHLR